MEQKGLSFIEILKKYWDFLEIIWKFIGCQVSDVLNGYEMFYFIAFSTRKIEKLDFWDANNSTNF